MAEAGEARIDVDDETVTCAAGVFEFEVEPDVKHRLLNGLDDIGITLENAAAIDTFEAGSGGDLRSGHDHALARAGVDEQRPARVGRRDLRRRLRPPVQLGDGGAGRLELSGEETVRRRRLRLAAASPPSWPSGCRAGA